MRRNLDERAARRLLSGGPVVLVTASRRGFSNVMPVAYALPLSIEPPLIGIVVHPSRLTFDIIKASDQFALNFPSPHLLHHVQYLGSVSGANVEKLELTQLPTFRARKVETVLLEWCVAWIECGVEEMIELGDHYLVVGRVLAALADEEAFSDHWLLQEDDAKPLHYLGANFYAVLSNIMEARVPKPAEEYDVKLQEAVDELLELTREAQERKDESAGEQEEFRRREGFEKPDQP